MTNDTLVIDIETVPHRADAYKIAFPNSKKKPGLHAICSEVVCIGIGNNKTIDILDRRSFPTEATILQRFSDMLLDNQVATIVTFNGKAFDIPVLKIRSMQYGFGLCFPDNRSHRNIDLYADYLGGKWQSDISSCTLRELIWFKYNEIAKTDAGDSVAELWAKGDLDAIAAHCEEDVRYTAKLYNDFKGILF